MNKQRECEEIIKNPASGKTYRFAGTFGFIRRLSLVGRDPIYIHNDLVDGKLPPEEIKDVIKFSLEQIDGVDVPDQDLEAEAIELVESAGLADSSALARLMMSHAMLGSLKKKQIRQSEIIQGMIFKPSRSHWKIVALAGLLLAGSFSGLIALAFTIYSYW